MQKKKFLRKNYCLKFEKNIKNSEKFHSLKELSQKLSTKKSLYICILIYIHIYTQCFFKIEILD